MSISIGIGSRRAAQRRLTLARLQLVVLLSGPMAASSTHPPGTSNRARVFLAPIEEVAEEGDELATGDLNEGELDGHGDAGAS